MIGDRAPGQGVEIVGNTIAQFDFLNARVIRAEATAVHVAVAPAMGGAALWRIAR